MKCFNHSLAMFCVLFALTACHQTKSIDSAAEANHPPLPSPATSTTSASYPPTNGNGLTEEELQAILAEQVLRQTPISGNEWDQITTDPYPRDPFLQNPQLSQRYFEAYLAARRTQWVDPGSLRIPPLRRGDDRTLYNAAWDAGWSAGMTRQTNQLTAEERERIKELKAMYDESLGNR